MNHEVHRSSKEEVMPPVKSKKSVKVVGPDNIPVTVWKCQRVRAVDN